MEVSFVLMSSSAGRTRAKGLGLIVALAVLGTTFMLASMASGAADTLKGGSVTLSGLKVSGIKKFSPKSPKLTITGGSVDPTTMSGSAVPLTGSTKATVKNGKKVVKIAFTSMDLTGNGGGSLDVKAGSKKVTKCFTFSGGTDGRSSFDGTITGGTLKISSACTKAIVKAAKKKAGKKVKVKSGKAGKLGSIDTIPATVNLKAAGTATLKFDASALAKLSAHGVLPNAGAGNGALNGVAPIAPATLDVPNVTFTFPIIGGAVAPDLSSGQIKLAGGIDLTKVNGSCRSGGGVTAGACTSDAGTNASNNPCGKSGSEVKITDLVFDLGAKATTATATVLEPLSPSSNTVVPGAPLSSVTLTSTTIDPNARSFTGAASLNNTSQGAGLENSLFGSSATPAMQGGPCNALANDFQPNATNTTPDPIGTSVLSAFGQ